MTATETTPPVLALICPCYNEEQIIDDSVESLRIFFGSLIKREIIDPASKIILVDDCSRDDSWPLILKRTESSSEFIKLRLIANVGHQNALMAGMEEAAKFCDCAVTLDFDLQDDVNVIEAMIAKFVEGCHLVLGVRKKRKTDSFFKKFSAGVYYRLLNLLGLPFVPHHADFRLLSKKVLEVLRLYPEKNLYLRGLIQMIGTRYETVHYDRRERIKGTSKYTFPKMLDLAWDGVTSFTAKPLKLIRLAGVFGVAVSFFLAFYALGGYFLGHNLEGWTSLFFLNVFFFGLQMIAIGMMGEYVAKIYSEVKNRPRYVVDRKVVFEGKEVRPEEEKKPEPQGFRSV